MTSGKQIGKEIVASMSRDGLLSKDTEITDNLLEEYLKRYWAVRGKPEKQLSRYKRLQKRIAALDLVRYRYATCDEHASQIKEGWIYIITNPAWAEYIKVGKAIDVSRRCADMQTFDPFRSFECVHQVFVADRHKAEKLVHKELAKFNSSGEWFKCSPEFAHKIMLKVKMLL